MDAGACRLRPARARRERRGMAARRVRWRTLGGRTRAVAMRIPKACRGDHGVRFCRCPLRPPVAVADVDPVAHAQHVLLGWRHVRSEATRAGRHPGTTVPAGRVFGHVGSCCARRRRP
jgi:hypothetical protein